MLNRKNKTVIPQHEVLRTPDGWRGQERDFIVQLERIHDDIYRHFPILDALNKKNKYIAQNQSQNDTTYVLDAPRNDKTRYATGLLFGATGSNASQAFMYIVFLGDYTREDIVTLTPVLAHGSYTFAGSWADGKLTINVTTGSTSKLWGGLNLIWMNN